MKQGMFKTMQYLLNILWQEDKKTFWMMILHIISGAFVPFVGVLIPSIVVSSLMRSLDIMDFSILVGFTLLVYGILQGGLSYLIQYNDFSFIAVRCSYFYELVYLGRAHIDYAFLEDEKRSVILEDALQALWSNNEGLEGMYHQFIEFMIALLGLCIFAISSSGLNLYLTLLLLLLALLQYFCFTKARNYEYSHRDTLDQYLKQSQYLNQLVYDQAAGKDIRLYQLQDWINGKFQKLNHLILHLRRKDYGAYMMVDGFAIVLDFVRDVLCYGFLIERLVHGLPIDQFVFYLGIITGFSMWFKKIEESYAQLSTFKILVNRMQEALQMENIMHHGDGEKIMGDDITITFDHVSFHYPKQERKILDDVSFTIHANEKLALVGVNGAGKTTIVKLILGFYLPTKGRILINGIATCVIDVEDIYQHITGIFQDSTLLSYSIAENVSMQDSNESDRKRIRECLQEVGLWEKVATLPKQELTHLFHDIEEDGIQLSGGQIQKLLMARVLYHQGKCLLLDEPTAALDALAEKAMYETYHELTNNKTSLFISHRLSSTRFCDNILVLAQGRIMEQGKHEELLSLHGIYAAMFEAQSKYYVKEGERDENL